MDNIQKLGVWVVTPALLLLISSTKARLGRSFTSAPSSWSHSIRLPFYIGQPSRNLLQDRWQETVNNGGKYILP